MGISSSQICQLQAGLAGYEQFQTTPKSGPQITASIKGERYNVNAIGFALNVVFPKAKANMDFRWFNELANRSTFEGYALQVAGAISF